jgi:hypothetical protein
VRALPLAVVTLTVTMCRLQNSLEPLEPLPGPASDPAEDLRTSPIMSSRPVTYVGAGAGWAAAGI